MDSDIKRLFELIRKNSNGKWYDEEIIDLIKTDDSLIEASNSYCSRCGWCCSTACANLKTDDNLAYCLLHDEEFPNGKKIPEYVTTRKLNPEEWAKPLICHTHGPHLGLIQEIRTGHNHYCPGSVQMIRDYKSFLEEFK